jgi:hypothetical protein
MHRSYDACRTGCAIAIDAADDTHATVTRGLTAATTGIQPSAPDDIFTVLALFMLGNLNCEESK